MEGAVSDHDSDETLCPKIDENNKNNIFIAEFLNWEKNGTIDNTNNVDKIKKFDDMMSVRKFTKSLLDKYEILEESLLAKMESGLSYIDNLIAIQAIFPALEKKTKHIKILKPLNYIIKQVAKIYIIMILIYIKRFLLRLKKINKLIKLIKTESIIMKRNFLISNSTIDEYHEKYLKVLYTEKIKSSIEIIGYFNDLLLNLNLVTKRFKLGRLMGKVVGFVSWVVNIYRLCRDESQDERNESVIKELQNKFEV